MAPKQFTLAEVSTHNSKNDLWIVIHDKVYDVTKFQMEVRSPKDYLESSS